jgi:glycosyltransferase involved in cell wall biosynthesis
MDAVTITDHNTINGAMEIAHLPGAFVSEEVTCYFPEDGCKIHVLVYDIDEAKHREIHTLREDIYSLIPYLHEEKIFHVLAHPLWSVNGRLTIDHFEKLLLLFKNFEINGSRDEQLNLFLQHILSGLTPDFIARLVETYGITPVFPEPWRKNLSGGSDDHSSLTISRIHTEVVGAAGLADFFAGMQKNGARINGHASSPHTLAHNLYSIAFQFYAHKSGLHGNARYNKIFNFLQTALTVSPDTNRFHLPKVSFSFFKRKSAAESKTSCSFTLLDLIKDEITRFIQEDARLRKIFRQIRSGKKRGEQEWFAFIKELSNKILEKFNHRLYEGLTGANFIDLLQSLTVMGIIYLLMLPYFAAYASFAQDRHFSQKVLNRFTEVPALDTEQAGKMAHFTDTFYEINGVALTLQKQAEEAQTSHKPYTIITCDVDGHQNCRCVRNFQPLAVWDLPEYREQKLFHPPVLEILDYCYAEKFSHILAATPGPMGLTALFVAQLLDLSIDGTYHTSLPQYAQYLTEDSSVEDLMWRYILWFYNQMQTIYSPSASTAAELTERGIDNGKIRTFPRGVDLHRFNPAKRNGYLETRYDLSEGLKLLYVGRISKEKNLEMLAKVFKALTQKRDGVHLIVVGDGPYFEEMQSFLHGTPCIFTGYLSGEDLAAVYASCDLFVFPSTTDTFGNVVLEAQASGIPVLVTDIGGPQENMIPEKTGLVVRGDDEEGLMQGLLALMDDPIRRRRMGKEARTYIEKRSFKNAFDATWQIYQGYAQAWGA